VAEFNGVIQVLAAEPAHGGTGFKLCQFFRYAAAEGQRQVQLWMPPQSRIPAGSPWQPLLDTGFLRPQPHPNPALLLLSDAADWRAAQRFYPGRRNLPKLQLLWGDDLRCWGHGARDQAAIRVALGSSVAEVLQRCSRFREPLHTMSVGLNPEDLPAAVLGDRGDQVLILASANPGLGLALQHNLRQRQFNCLCELTPWPLQRWLTLLSHAAVAVVLAPPAGQPSLGLHRLASMALRTPLVAEQRDPDDGLCRDGANCLVRPGDPAALADAAAALLDPANSGLRAKLVDGGLASLVRHRRARERLEFNQLLEQLSLHWQQAIRCHPELET
jgi:hypothetical protein